MTLISILLTAIAFLVLLAIFLLTAYQYRTSRMSLFIIIDSKLIITIHDATGHHATFSKSMRLRANHKGITQYVHRNLSSDGSMQNFKVDNRPVTPQKDAGDYLIYADFGQPLQRGAEREMTLELELIDSFLSNPEWVTYHVAHPTKKIAIEVILPKERPASLVDIFCFRGGEIEPVSTKPDLLDSGHRIVWNAEDQRNVGIEYRLQWTWPEIQA